MVIEMASEQIVFFHCQLEIKVMHAVTIYKLIYCFKGRSLKNSHFSNLCFVVPAEKNVF
jgi:hypothetical protein